MLGQNLNPPKKISAGARNSQGVSDRPRRCGTVRREPLRSRWAGSATGAADVRSADIYPAATPCCLSRALSLSLSWSSAASESPHLAITALSASEDAWQRGPVRHVHRLV